MIPELAGPDTSGGEGGEDDYQGGSIVLGEGYGDEGLPGLVPIDIASIAARCPWASGITSSQGDTCDGGDPIRLTANLNAAI